MLKLGLRRLGLGPVWPHRVISERPKFGQVSVTAIERGRKKLAFIFIKPSITIYATTLIGPKCHLFLQVPATDPAQTTVAIRLIRHFRCILHCVYLEHLASGVGTVITIHGGPLRIRYVTTSF